MQTPIISVIIPTYNRPYALSELIESLYRQTYKSFEVIIVNDHGNSPEFIKDLYSELDIKVFHVPENKGHVHARNVGLTHAKGQYIMLIDDDDLIVHDHMETMIKEIGDFDFIYTDAEIFDYEIHNNVRIPTRRDPFSYQHDYNLICKFSTFISTGCMYKKSVHDQIGVFDEDIKRHWDFDLILSVSKSCKVRRLNRASGLYAFSMGGDNASINHKNMRQSLDLLCKKHRLGELPTHNLYTVMFEPEMIAKKAEATIVWDGKPIISRLIQKQGTI